jgi:hypothetical protein
VNCKNTGRIGKDLKRKVNPDDSTDPDDMKRTNGSFYMSGFCYKRLYEKRKAAAKRLQSTRQTRSQAEPRLAPVASRRARPTEVDALAADGEWACDSALIVVSVHTALSVSCADESRARSRLRSGAQIMGGAAKDTEREIDTMNQEEGGGSVGLPHEGQTEKEEEEEDAMDVGDVVVTVIMGLSSLRAG